MSDSNKTSSGDLEPAGDGQKAKRSPKRRSAPAKPEEIPLATQRAADSLMERFWEQLSDRALSNMNARGSSTPTDADLEDAYRQLTRPTQTNRVKNFIGDGALVIGGVLMPLYGTNFSLTIAGFMIAGLGLYVREFTE